MQSDARPLTKNQRLVLDELSASDAPLTAYTILDQLRDSGLRSPPQIYRSLEQLIELGLVHRIETLDAFVTCDHGGCANHAHAVFMICDVCDHVDEITDKSLTDPLSGAAIGLRFQLNKAVIELRGTCKNCGQGEACQS